MKKSDIKKLDKLWSQIIRNRGKCEVCGKHPSGNSYLNPHHIVGRRNYTLRWDIRNGVALCAGHHIFNRESAHQDSEWFHDWLEENRKEDLEYLRKRRNLILKQTYEEVVDKLKST